MTDQTELDIPLPSEDEERRWTSGALLVALGAGAIALGLGYFIWPRPLRAVVPVASATPVAVLKEPAFKAATPPVRPSKVVLQAKSGHSVVPKTSRDFGAAAAQPASFLDVVRRTNAKAYVGRMLRFDSVNVVTSPVASVLSVGPNSLDSVMVKVDPAVGRAKKLPPVRPGEKVFLVGRLLPAPTEETLRRWGLSSDDERRIGHRNLYIRAVVVQDAPAHF